MNILYLIAYWYTYSKWYILGSIFVTHILNVAFKKLYLSPLIINAVSIIILFLGIYFKIIKNEEVGISFISIYMPIVFSSILMNIIIYLYRKIKIKIKDAI